MANPSDRQVSESQRNLGMVIWHIIYLQGVRDLAMPWMVKKLFSSIYWF